MKMINHKTGKLDRNQSDTRNYARSSLSIVFIIIGLLAISILVGAGCGNNKSATGPNNSVENNSDNSNGSNDPGIPELSYFEEQLIGLWSRYHAYDGSSMYIYFEGDRTACKWEEASGSNTRRSKSSYSNWYIDEDNPVGESKFRVIVEGAGITYVYDFAADKIWPSSYTNLSYYPSVEGKVCE